MTPVFNSLRDHEEYKPKKIARAIIKAFLGYDKKMGDMSKNYARNRENENRPNNNNRPKPDDIETDEERDLGSSGW